MPAIENMKALGSHYQFSLMLLQLLVQMQVNAGVVNSPPTLHDWQDKMTVTVMLMHPYSHDITGILSHLVFGQIGQ